MDTLISTFNLHNSEAYMLADITMSMTVYRKT